MHVFRWDLDRTYLDTEISSVRGLVRAALEDAVDKRTVPGAAPLLRGLTAADPDARVVIVSGSPEQMRDVLLQKLALDGVRVDALVLKDNLGNLKRGRWRAVRGQIGYKLPALLEDRAMTPGARETLFGDDAEADALIYATYAGVLAGEVSEADLVAVLRAGEAYPDMIDRAVAAARVAPRGDAVRDIFIRVDRGLPLGTYRLLGPRVRPVFGWFQAALVLHGAGALGPAALGEVGRVDVRSISGLALDAVRRNLVDREGAVAGLAAALPEVDLSRFARDLDRMGPISPRPVTGRDFLGFLDAVRRAE